MYLINIMEVKVQYLRCWVHSHCICVGDVFLFGLLVVDEL